MICAEAREALLAAEIHELEGDGNSPLARHLAGCAGCRKAATTILRDEGLLAVALTTLLPQPDVDALLELGLNTGISGSEGAAIRETTRDTLPLPRGSSFPSRRLTVGSLALASLAAAAGLAALLFPRMPSPPGPVYTPPARAMGLEVEAPPGQDVAVLETGDPDITVLWLF